MNHRLPTMVVSFFLLAVVLLPEAGTLGARPPQRGQPASTKPPGGRDSRYAVTQTADIVQLRDTREDIVVSVLTPASNAYEMIVRGQDVIRRNFASLDALRANTGLNGIPLLWPYANRLDEQAFYANGTKYSFDTGLGNTGRGAIPIHGYLTNSKEWKLVEAKADGTGAWVTSRLEFYRNPRFMKQFPFAHVLTMTYRLADGMLEVRTVIENLSNDPMPVAIGFHPYFQLTDSTRDDWTLAIRAKTHWLLNTSTIPTGETQAITQLLPDPHNVSVKEFPSLDDVFTDLERDSQGRATMTLRGKKQELDVIAGPNFKTMLVLTRTGGGRRGVPPPTGGQVPGAASGSAAAAPTAPTPSAPAPAATTPATPTRGSVALEPMAGISNAMNLAQKGLYRELQSIPPGEKWEESFWIRPRGF